MTPTSIPTDLFMPDPVIANRIGDNPLEISD
jgi:hypothetical protein